MFSLKTLGIQKSFNIFYLKMPENAPKYDIDPTANNISPINLDI
jgi:hypothetical protein